MKKILLSLGIVTFVVAASVTATGAFFSDSETSTGNTFTAGSIDLSLGSQFTSMANGSSTLPLLANNAGRALYNFNDIKPGDFGSGSFNLVVTSNESFACAKTNIATSSDNGIVDPEADAGDITDGVGFGELQNFLQFATFADFDGDGVLDPGEPLNVNQYGGDSNGFTAAEISLAGWVSVADTNSPNTWLTIGSLTPGTPYHAGIMYCFGNFDLNGVCNMYPINSNDNLAQTDSISGSIEFMAVQTRNNPGFQCTSLNPQV